MHDHVNHPPPRVSAGPPPPPAVLPALLDFAHVGPGDVVFDLGCGDGRVLCAAAERGATGHGWDIDPAAVADAEARIRRQGCAELVWRGGQPSTGVAWGGGLPHLSGRASGVTTTSGEPLKGFKQSKS